MIKPLTSKRPAWYKRAQTLLPVKKMKRIKEREKHEEKKLK